MPVFSHTKSGFPLFLHISVPTRGENTKGTAARRPHAGRTSIRDVIVMLK